MNADDADIMLATTKAGGGWLPLSTEAIAADALDELVERIADTCAACGVGSRLAYQVPGAGRATWDGPMATDPIRRAILARGFAVEVFEDSVVVLAERNIREVDVADWFGVKRPAGDRMIQLAEATRFCRDGTARTALILDPLLPSRLVLPYGGRDLQLERLAIESEAAAYGPVADTFDGHPIEVGIYGRSIAVIWATACGAFPVWFPTDGARYLCRVPAVLSSLLDDASLLTDPHEWAAAACRSLGANLTDRGLELTPLLPGAPGADITSHLDPGEVATHRWAIVPRRQQ